MEPIDFIIRILAATAAGGAVGLEREINNKSAGLRTNTLVAIGAAIYVLISLQVLNEGKGMLPGSWGRSSPESASWVQA